MIFYAIISIFFLQFSTNLFAQDLEQAKAIYIGKCSLCHGDNGEGVKGEGPSLNNQTFLSLATDDYITKIIKEGRQDSNMKLSSRKLRKIIPHIPKLLKFIRSWEKNYKNFKMIQLNTNLVLKGDKANGQKLYNKTCAKCHSDDASGYTNGFESDNIGTAIGSKGFLAQSSDDFIKKTIERGRKGKMIMPAFSTSFGAKKDQALKSQEINDIIVYLRSL